jgi:hypothetical protein
MKDSVRAREIQLYHPTAVGLQKGGPYWQTGTQQVVLLQKQKLKLDNLFCFQ